MFNSWVEENCFKHLQDIITITACNVAGVFFQKQCFKLLKVLNWRLKNSREKAVSQRQRKVLPCFVPEIWGKKFRNRNFFIGPPTHPYGDCNWHKFRELPIGQEQSVWAKSLQNIHSSAFSWSSTLERNNLSLTAYF